MTKLSHMFVQYHSIKTIEAKLFHRQGSKWLDLILTDTDNVQHELTIFGNDGCAAMLEAITIAVQAENAAGTSDPLPRIINTDSEEASLSSLGD